MCLQVVNCGVWLCQPCQLGRLTCAIGRVDSLAHERNAHPHKQQATADVLTVCLDTRSCRNFRHAAVPIAPRGLRCVTTHTRGAHERTSLTVQQQKQQVITATAALSRSVSAFPSKLRMRHCPCVCDTDSCWINAESRGTSTSALPATHNVVPRIKPCRQASASVDDATCYRKHFLGRTDGCVMRASATGDGLGTQRVMNFQLSFVLQIDSLCMHKAYYSTAVR